MSYSTKLEIVKNNIIRECKELILENWERMFDMWLNVEADHEFSDIYNDEFKKEFNQYINVNIEHQLWFASKNIIYGIEAFMSSSKTIKLKDVLKFVENFVVCQLADFDNWCDEIMDAMPDEETKDNDDPS